MERKGKKRMLSGEENETKLQILIARAWFVIPYLYPSSLRI